MGGVHGPGWVVGFEVQVMREACIPFVMARGFVRPWPTPRSVNRDPQALQRYG